MQFPFVGGSYEGRSKDINAQRTINLYPELDKEGGKVPIALHGTPGLIEFSDIGTNTEIRGMIVVGNYLYAVCGISFYEIASNGDYTLRGTLSSVSGHCWLEYNGDAYDQIMIVDGETGYIYDTSTQTLSEITDTDFPGASSLTYQDTYFIVSEPDADRFWVSDAGDGTSWDGTYFGTLTGGSDNLVAVLSDHRELWCFGKKTTEVWYNSGVGSPPFDRKIDEVLQRGCGATASIVAEDNTIFWIDDRGMAVKAEGYKPTTISTRQIEYQWAQYETISDAIGFTYIMEGHTFIVWVFPTANKTWSFDAATNMWHERSSFFDFEDARWRANCYAKFGDKHLIGDFENGKIYEMSLDIYDEDGNVLRAIRRAPVIADDGKMIFHHSLEIEFESGVGLSSGQGVDPQAMLRWSNDGGHTWSNEHSRSIGKIGEYEKRARWNRLGRSRNRVYEVTITDPVKRVIIGANINASKGRA